MPETPLAQRVANIPPSGIREIFDRVNAMPDAISLCVGEPSASASTPIVVAACDSLLAGRSKYTNIRGIDEFREAASAYTARVKGLKYNPESEIQVVAGGTLGLTFAMQAVINPSDEVIIPSPFFTSYDTSVTLCGGVPVFVPLKPEHGMRLNAEDIARAVTPRTRAIIVNSPGNPSGAVTSRAELEQIARVCIEHDLWVISDEVYHRFLFDGTDCAPTIARVPGMRERTIMVDSLSKTYAMTGWRIGYISAPARVIDATAKLAETMCSSVNSTAQYGATAAMRGDDTAVESMREQYARNREIAMEVLAGSPELSLVEPQGAFYGFIDISTCGVDAHSFALRLLEEKKVAVVPGEAFGQEGAGFVRISYVGDSDELRLGLERMRDFAHELAGDMAQAVTTLEMAD